VIEAGLGGRYDATNVIPSQGAGAHRWSGLEHTRWLGPTVADIAEEKLAVVREPRSARHRAARSRCRGGGGSAWLRERHARRVQVTGSVDYKLAAHGSFQRANFALDRAAAEAFVGELDEGAVRRADAEVPRAWSHAGGVGGAAHRVRRRAQNPD